MPDGSHMKRFWDARARENAKYFVDNRLDYRGGDDGRFWSEGETDLDRMLEQTGSAFAPGDRVLDIGCGLGRLTRVAAGRAAHVTGLDVSAEMVSRAREQLTGVENAEFVEGDGVSLRPLADASFDAVISLVVFQHIPDPQVTLGYVREIGRVLSPGGWAAIQVSNDARIHTADYATPSRLRKLLGRAPKGQDDPAWRGSAVDLDDVAAAAADGGLRVTRTANAGTQFCLLRLEDPAA